MIKSNISIVSNIYIRSDPNIGKDKRYTGKITGAKLLGDICKHYMGFEAIALTDVQKQILSSDLNCAYAKNGEKSYGAVMIDGIPVWQCRCEYTNCSGYNDCVPQVIHREGQITEDKTEEKKERSGFFCITWNTYSR